MIAKILSVLEGQKRRLAGLLTMTAISGAGMSALNPLMIKMIFDEGVIKGDFPRFVGLAVGFVIVATMWRWGNMKIALFTRATKDRALKRLSGSLLERYYGLPYERVAAREPAYHASRIFDEPREAVEAAVELSTDLVGSAVNAAAAITVIFLLSPRATLALAAAAPVLLYLSQGFSSRIHRESKREKEREGALRGELTRSVEAFRTVNSFGLLGGVLRRADEQTDRFLARQYARCEHSVRYGTLASICASYAETAVIVVCGYEMLRGAMSFGDLMAFMNAFWIAMGGVRSLIAQVPEIARTEALIDRIGAFGAVGAAAGRPREIAAGVVFEGAEFRYGERTVFSGLDFSVGEGERVLLSGANGCGKSTAANLIAGFLNLSRGRVAAFPRERVSACVSPHAFVPGTLRYNLRYDELDADAREKADAILADFDLFDRLDANPSRFSAGERKKAEVAMGLLKDADLYLFDEPLANVDAASKRPVMDWIHGATAGKTLIVVMHGDVEFCGRFDREISLEPRIAA